MANLWLKEGHNLLEKDMLPVVGRLTSLSQDAWRAKIEDPASVPLASFCKNHLLCSYSGEELADQFHKMTGYEILVGVYNVLSLNLCSRGVLKGGYQLVIFLHKCDVVMITQAS